MAALANTLPAIHDVLDQYAWGPEKNIEYQFMENY
jgi:hypothetical protein